jgi:hypothetical protein
MSRAIRKKDRREKSIENLEVGRKGRRLEGKRG